MSFTTYINRRKFLCCGALFGALSCALAQGIPSSRRISAPHLGEAEPSSGIRNTNGFDYWDLGQPVSGLTGTASTAGFDYWSVGSAFRTIDSP